MTDEVNPGSDNGDGFEHSSRVHVIQRESEDSTHISYHVIETVSKLTETPPEEMQPLYEVIDPDALQHLFTWKNGDTGTIQNGELQFQYEGCEIVLRTDGRTIVLLPETDAT